jgi:hypothetical protein
MHWSNDAGFDVLMAVTTICHSSWNVVRDWISTLHKKILWTKPFSVTSTSHPEIWQDRGKQQKYHDTLGTQNRIRTPESPLKHNVSRTSCTGKAWVPHNIDMKYLLVINIPGRLMGVTRNATLYHELEKHISSVFVLLGSSLLIVMIHNAQG